MQIGFGFQSLDSVVENVPRLGVDAIYAFTLSQHCHYSLPTLLYSSSILLYLYLFVVISNVIAEL
jgi:hypothetical protein